MLNYRDNLSTTAVFVDSLSSYLDSTTLNIDSSEKLLHYTKQFETINRIDSALDLVFQTVDNFIDNLEFEKCDSALALAEPRFLSVQTNLALLTSTYPEKSHLPSRNYLFKRLHNHLSTQRSAKEADEILVGLE